MPPITMGQEELVLRVSGEPDGGSPHSPASSDSVNNQSKADKARLTHSRESSGASVKVGTEIAIYYVHVIKNAPFFSSLSTALPVL